MATRPTERKEAEPPKLELWQREDAQRLIGLWRAYKKRTGTSQAEFASENDLGTQANISHYLNARQPLNIESATNFARGLGCSIDAFSPRLAKLARDAVDATEQTAEAPLATSPQSVAQDPIDPEISRAWAFLSADQRAQIAAQIKSQAATNITNYEHFEALRRKGIVPGPLAKERTEATKTADGVLREIDPDLAERARIVDKLSKNASQGEKFDGTTDPSQRDSEVRGADRNRQGHPAGKRGAKIGTARGK